MSWRRLDMAALGAGIGVLLPAALLASFVPAWKAMRVDPKRALAG